MQLSKYTIILLHDSIYIYICMYACFMLEQKVKLFFFFFLTFDPIMLCKIVFLNLCGMLFISATFSFALHMHIV